MEEKTMHDDIHPFPLYASPGDRDDSREQKTSFFSSCGIPWTDRDTSVFTTIFRIEIRFIYPYEKEHEL